MELVVRLHLNKEEIIFGIMQKFNDCRTIDIIIEGRDKNDRYNES